MHLSSKDCPWGKTFTNKRYLHPPLCENIVTMWSSSMILCGQIKAGSDSQISYGKKQYESVLPSCAIIFTRKGQFLPQYQIKYNVRGDGIPVHSFEKPFGELIFRQQAFCSIERVPKVFTEVSIHNPTKETVNDSLGIMLRVGAELDLVGTHEPDGYFLVEQNIGLWEKLEKSDVNGNIISNGNNYVVCKTKEQCNIITGDIEDIIYNFSIKPGKTIKFRFMLCNSLKKDFDYQREKVNTLKFWKNELDKAEYLPGNKKTVSLIYNFISQNLQMFCYAKNENYVLVRQGGLNRYTWPNEAVSMLCAMAEVGGYENYLDAALDTYFNVLQRVGYWGENMATETAVSFMLEDTRRDHSMAQIREVILLHNPTPERKEEAIADTSARLGVSPGSWEIPASVKPIFGESLTNQSYELYAAAVRMHRGLTGDHILLINDYRGTETSLIFLSKC